MAIDAIELAHEMNELRALAAKKLVDEPLPMGREATVRLQDDIRKNALESHVVELETEGYTVLPPGKAAPLELFDRLRETILRFASAAEGESNFASRDRGLGQTLFHLLPRDRVFEEALMAPAPLTLATYLLGYRAKLSQSTALIKQKGSRALGLHADHSAKIPAPWPRVSQYSVVTWVLTEYTRENGAVCVWPGSHRFCQPVPPHLTMAHDHEEIRVLEVPAGSVIIWNGSLWHGAVPRTTEGKRVTLVFPHCRDHIQAQELYWATTTPEMIERNSARFATLMGLTSVNPWIQDGPSGARLAMGPATGSHYE